MYKRISNVQKEVLENYKHQKNECEKKNWKHIVGNKSSENLASQCLFVVS